jgi:CheY-like chemotaxis protein
MALLRQALVVDDSPAVLNQITRYLDDMQIACVAAMQGASAVSQALQHQPDIIILDLLLPDISGWEVMAALQANPQTRNIPILIISTEAEQERARALGAAGYLVKPIKRAQLHDALRAIFPTAALPPQRALVVATEPAVQPTGPLILLAEDNDQSSAMLSEYLESKGYRVSVARNGSEAIDQARELRPALILMDIQMPGTDGLEATRRIRADASLVSIPIIAVTALAMPGDRERCLDAGANDYLSKPVQLKQLVQMIAQFLQEPSS